ncbi:MAG TPA: hypothetical protein PLB05_02310 [Candidatus Omnitrophota bacterium]|nr:hypothetical protein [Candidatus Omnitrophota bacterium]
MMNHVKFDRKILMTGGLLAGLCLSQTVSAGEMELAKRHGPTRHKEERGWSSYDHGSHAMRYPDHRHYRLLSPYFNVEGGGQFIRSLPFRTERIYFNGAVFYYYNGLFYRPKDYGYILVAAPIGICVARLPAVHRGVIHHEGPAYEHNGHFYVKYHGKYKVIAP